MKTIMHGIGGAPGLLVLLAMAQSHGFDGRWVGVLVGIVLYDMSHELMDALYDYLSRKTTT